MFLGKHQALDVWMGEFIISIHLYTILSIHLSIYPSMHLFIHLYINISINISIYLSIYLNTKP